MRSTATANVKIKENEVENMLELQHLSFRVDAEGQDKEILDDMLGF